MSQKLSLTTLAGSNRRMPYIEQLTSQWAYKWKKASSYFMLVTIVLGYEVSQLLSWDSKPWQFKAFHYFSGLIFYRRIFCHCTQKSIHTAEEPVNNITSSTPISSLPTGSWGSWSEGVAGRWRHGAAAGRWLRRWWARGGQGRPGHTVSPPAPVTGV